MPAATLGLVQGGLALGQVQGGLALGLVQDSLSCLLTVSLKALFMIPYIWDPDPIPWECMGSQKKGKYI